MVEDRLNAGAMLPDDPDPERALATAYAPAAARPALTALWALDATLARIVATTSDPMIGQLRLTWWHDALVALDTAPPPAEPVLRALAAAKIGGAVLTPIVEGWEELLDPAPGPAALERHAALRGGTLFSTAADVLGSARDTAAVAGAGWALADLARRGVPNTLALAAPHLAAESGRWDRAGRPLGMLAKLARRDVGARTPERQGSPRRLLAMATHALTGR